MRASLDHFVELARRGRHPAASGGERRACQLAEAVLEQVPGLDDEAVVGLMAFIQWVKRLPVEARETVEEG